MLFTEEAVQALETSTTSEISTLDERITSKCSQLEKGSMGLLCLDLCH